MDGSITIAGTDYIVCELASQEMKKMYSKSPSSTVSIS